MDDTSSTTKVASGTTFIIQVERLERKMKKEVCHIVYKSNTVEI